MNVVIFVALYTYFQTNLSSLSFRVLFQKQTCVELQSSTRGKFLEAIKTLLVLSLATFARGSYDRIIDKIIIKLRMFVRVGTFSS